MLITKQLLVAIDLKTTREVNGYQELFGYNHVEERKKIKQVSYEISEGKRWLTFPFGFNRPFKLFFFQTQTKIFWEISFFFFLVHTMEDNGNQNDLITNTLQQKKVSLTHLKHD